jgi:mannose-6-phosphate isomerase-like protein (cupin superfamily)
MLKNDRLPWIEVDDFELVELDRVRPVGVGKPTERFFEATSLRQRIMVVVGEVRVESPAGRVTLQRRDWFDIPAGGALVSNVSFASAELVAFSGTWTEDLRTEICSFSDEYPCEYHYHDSDEYWFVYRGHFTLDYDERKYSMRPGLMLAAGMGWEHGSTAPEEHFEAVVFATRLEGAGRDGHLLREFHGAPVKARDVPPGHGVPPRAE